MKKKSDRIPIKFATQLRKTDFVWIFIIFWVQMKKNWMAVLGYFLIINGIATAFTKNYIVYSTIIVFIWALIILSYRLIQYIKLVSKDTRTFEKINWELNDDNIEAHGNTFTLKVNKSDIFKVYELKKYFFVYTDDKDFFLFPKYQIINADLEILTSFLKEKIKSKVIMKK